MTRNREIPDYWPDESSAKPGGKRPLDGSPSDKRRAAENPKTRPVPGKALRRTGNPVPAQPVPRNQVGLGTRGSKGKGGTPVPPPPHGSRGSQEPMIPNPQSPIPQPRKRRSLFSSWSFWGILIVLLSGSLGFMSVALLFKLPSLPNCPSIFWPTASASLRLYCAQLAANKQTVGDLLEAIELVNTLPADHPLRAEINRHLEEWSLDILKLAETTFQAGRLSEAIGVARKIPSDVPAYSLVEERIERWESLWTKAEEIYKKAEQQLRESNWNQAFREAVQLLAVGNDYWATTKYDELVGLIQTAREESGKLDKAYKLARQGGLENLLAAIKQAEQIPQSSFAYKEARDLITDCGNKLIELAQERLENRDWQSVVAIANKIPPSLNLQVEAQDLLDLANAQSRAQEGTVEGLEAGIALAQKLNLGRPLYDKAQELITRWQREIEDVAHLDRARGLAQSATIPDLQAAITEAQLIPSANPRYLEAKAEINRWSSQIQTMEDRPYLDRATQLASFGDIGSLTEAINEANRVSQGRALYPEARRKVRTWTDQVERLQDQPYLDQARNLADAGNLSSAIATADQIRPGRALYRDAQSRIRQWTRQIERIQDQPYLDQAQVLANSGNLASAIAAAEQIGQGRALYAEAQERVRGWRAELQAQQGLQEALQLANSGTPDAIASAIQAARRVSNSSSVSSSAKEAINRWSYQLLAMAQERANSDLQAAIRIAEGIPSGTSAYSDAQRLIRAWRQSLQPQAPLGTTTY